MIRSFSLTSFLLASVVFADESTLEPSFTTLFPDDPSTQEPTLMDTGTDDPVEINARTEEPYTFDTEEPDGDEKTPGTSTEEPTFEDVMSSNTTSNVTQPPLSTDCFDNTTELGLAMHADLIEDLLARNESFRMGMNLSMMTNMTNTSTNMTEMPTPPPEAHRTYSLCPNTSYDLDNNMSPLYLYPNTIIQCGEFGLSSDNCRLVGGSVQILVANETDMVESTVRGLTLQDSEQVAAYLDRPGSVTFDDCIFQVRYSNTLP